VDGGNRGTFDIDGISHIIVVVVVMVMITMTTNTMLKLMTMV